MVPVLPVNEIVVVVPEQIVAVPVAVHATGVGLTVTVIATLGPSQPDAFT